MEKQKKAYRRYTTDKEWDIILPYLPEKSPIGRPLKWEWRDLMDAIFYVTRTGCQWRYLPSDFPAWSTVYRHFQALRDSQFWQKLNDIWSAELRQEAGKEALPTAAIIDSQSVRASDTGSQHGYDAGKKIKGSKRHILVDTLGFLMAVVVHSAGEQDCHGAVKVLAKADQSPRSLWLKLIWADGGYERDSVTLAAKEFDWQLQVVKRSDDQKGFVVLPHRWVVERTFSWLARNRRLAKDYERHAETAECFIYLSMCRLMLARLAALPL